MSIASLDNYIASVKQRVQFIKTASRTTIATFPFSVFELAGNPGAGTLAGASTAAGVVPDDTVGGYPALNTPTGGAIAYLSKVEFANTVAAWFDLYDRLFVCGAYAYNAAVTLSGAPSYSARVPGTDYKGLQIWVECVVAPTGNLAVTVTYYNQNGSGDGVKTTGAVGIGAQPTVGRCWMLPLAAGDTGVSQILSVTGSVATVGAACFNVMVLRPLWSGRVQIANGGDVHDLLKTGMPVIVHPCALYVLISADSTSSGIPELMIEVASN